MVRCLATINVLSFVKGVKGLLDTLRLSAALTLRLLLLALALTLQLVYKVGGGIYEVVVDRLQGTDEGDGVFNLHCLHPCGL